jgi:hypothetical protein
MYNPLVGGIPMIDVDGDGEVDTVPTGDDKNSSGPKSSGRPVGRPKGTTGIPRQVNASEFYSRKDIQEIVYKIENLETHASLKMKEHFKVKELNDDQKNLTRQLCESVILAKDHSMWKRTVSSCVKDFNKIEKLNILPKILEASQKHEIEAYPAALLYHSKKKMKTK